QSSSLSLLVNDAPTPSTSILSLHDALPIWKSTSMNVTVGLLSPRRGAVSVYGRTVTGRTPEAIAALGVALVPQGRRVFRSLTVRDRKSTRLNSSHCPTPYALLFLQKHNHSS